MEVFLLVKKYGFFKIKSLFLTLVTTLNPGWPGVIGTSGRSESTSFVSGTGAENEPRRRSALLTIKGGCVAAQ